MLDQTHVAPLERDNKFDEGYKHFAPPGQEQISKHLAPPEQKPISPEPRGGNRQLEMNRWKKY